MLCVFLGTQCRKYLGDSVTMELPGKEVASMPREPQSSVSGTSLVFFHQANSDLLSHFFAKQQKGVEMSLQGHLDLSSSTGTVSVGIMRFSDPEFVNEQ